nr:hypothetical protein [Demequina litorisediminis]
MTALRALRDGGYVGRPDAAKMDRSYRQLRVWEHRLQLRAPAHTPDARRRGGQACAGPRLGLCHSRVHGRGLARHPPGCTCDAS